MDIYNMNKFTGRGKKPTTLKVSIKCDTKADAKNIRLCILEMLREINVDNKRIKTRLDVGI